MLNNQQKSTAVYNMHKRRLASGFALVEVLLAALTMAVGSAAFLKLHSMSLKYSSNNYARTQALSIATGFVEQLRSNRGFMDLATADRTGAIIAGNIAVASAPAPQNESDCASGNPGSACVRATFTYHTYLTSQKMLYSFQRNLSMLCYRESASVRGYLRITYLWRDGLSDTKTAFTAADCPNSFSATTAALATDRNNSVTIYAQL